MVECVDCKYQSKRGNKHWDHCRLMLLEFIRQEAPVDGIPEITDSELEELEGMIAEMLRRGASRGDDGYFGECVINDASLPPREEG